MNKIFIKILILFLFITNQSIAEESKVFVVEKLGSGTFLYLEKEGEPLVVQTEGDSQIKVGDTVKVGFSSSRCHIFDSSNNAFK